MNKKSNSFYKIIFIIFFIFSIFIFLSCSTTSITTKNEIKKEKIVLSVWDGFYDASFHSDGTISDWILYSDGTLTGEWITENGSFIISLEGTYSLRENIVIFKASGKLSLPTKDITNVEITGGGTLLDNQGEGIFILFVEHPDYPDDIGGWYVEKK